MKLTLPTKKKGESECSGGGKSTRPKREKGDLSRTYAGDRTKNKEGKSIVKFLAIDERISRSVICVEWVETYYQPISVMWGEIGGDAGW